MNIRLLPRSAINEVAWNACVAASSNPLVYGYSWYIDAVTSLPDWSWAGLVVPGSNGYYRAVMPVPLRRKWGRWVVHQPLFCQVLDVFSPETIDPTPFFAALQQRFRYASVLQCRRISDSPALRLQNHLLHTHLLDLSPDYETIARQYSPDRKLNLRRAEAANWLVADSADPEPLIRLFQENHAAGIPNGVAPWAYDLFRRLFAELQNRELATVRYARKAGQIQAGALFVRDENRLIYLFNAASAAGRQGNARTLLIDRVIRENCGRRCVLDFESPEKSSITQFYKSFGAGAVPFWAVRYDRLTWVEQRLHWVLNRTFRSVSGVLK